MEALSWFNDAMANGYQDDLLLDDYCSQQPIVLQFHDKEETYSPLRNILFEKKYIERIYWEKEEQKMIEWCFRVKIATLLSDNDTNLTNACNRH